MYTPSHTKQNGFTIVELLIVIVIIAILAAITIVAYNGIQQRARYSTMQQDISSINKAILLYYADNGSYPYTGTGGYLNTADSTQTLNIPGISKYLPKVPQIPNDGVSGFYIYVSDGANYKIGRLVHSASDLPGIEKSDPKADPIRPGRGWGYWSSGGSAF